MADVIKEMFDNILKETDETKKAELQTAFDLKLKEISTNSDELLKIKGKGIFQELKEAKEKLKALEDAENLTKEEKLKAAGKLQELIDAKALKLAELQTSLDLEKAEKEKYKKDAEAFLEYQKSRKEKLIAVLKNDDLKGLANKFSNLEDLETFVKLHSTEKLPFIDNGQAYGGGGDVTLTEADKLDAEEKGMTLENYKIFKANMSKVKESLKK